MVPSLSARVEPWQYGKAWYRCRIDIERLVRRLKWFRRILRRFDRLDVMFVALLSFTLIVEALR